MVDPQEILTCGGSGHVGFSGFSVMDGRSRRAWRYSFH